MVLKLEEYRHDAEACIRCSNCRFIEHLYIQSQRFGRQCPINGRYAFNLYSAHGLLQTALAVMNNELEFTPKLLDALNKCTLCGACDVRCKRNLDIEVLSVIEALKARAVESGQGPLPEHKKMAERISNNHNCYGLPHDDRIKWITDTIKPKDKADILYFVGCRSSYKNKEIARATAKILAKTNTDFMVSSEEWCCGYPLFSTGQIKEFKKQANHNIEMLKKSGASTVLVSCAEGYKTWKVDYPKVMGKSTAEMGFKVVHIVELMDQRLKEGGLKLTNSGPMKVTYHDPCNLGRLSEPWYHWEGKYLRYGVAEPSKTYRRGEKGIYEPPRNILKAIPGIELVEMERAKDNSWCCGAGAGVDVAFRDFALWTASERLVEAESTGAEAIVTCCPACKGILTEAAKANEKKIKVYDITEIFTKSMA
jgi:Fe-S oxidoreductase